MAFIRHGDTVRGHAPERAFRRNPATRRAVRCPGTGIAAYSGMGYGSGCLPVDALGTGCGIPEPDIPATGNAFQALFQARSEILCPGTGSPCPAPFASSDRVKPGRRAYADSPAALLAGACLFRPASSFDINSRRSARLLPIITIPGRFCSILRRVLLNSPWNTPFVLPETSKSTVQPHTRSAFVLAAPPRPCGKGGFFSPSGKHQRAMCPPI